MWMKHEGLRGPVSLWWSQPHSWSGSKDFIFFKKLQYIKENMKRWNRKVFKNIFIERDRVELNLENLHSRIIGNGMSEMKFEEEKMLKKEYAEILAKEETYWRQKSRELWLKEGDRNTIFFHNLVKVRRSLNNFFSITSQDGKILEDPEEINKEAIEYFSNFLKGTDTQDGDVKEVLSFIPKCISASQNNMLMNVVSLEEVKATLFSMGGEKLPSQMA
ncbi:uncharacterized protein LOC131054554 [Cryptomeria japonica]|uniref:uncharacterized protein LOC131054554 n=1 Tax=Cryptomeria japonica TaxID=3369 RepID=UPI0027D9F723|nr:uncharacterized protein LOC131054554 [Cryptomeria japonica]